MERNSRILLLKLAAFCIFVGLISPESIHYFNISRTEQAFQRFIVDYDKNYTKGTEEYEKKLAIFKLNSEVHEKLNKLSNDSSLNEDAASATARYGVTKFSDLTSEQFREKYLSGLKSPVLTDRSSHVLHWASNRPNRLGSIPKTFDWRDHAVVSYVRNQESCGGCWAFAAVGLLETMNAITHSTPVKALSEQQVLDCSYKYKILSGCDGGDTCVALDWMIQSKTGLVSRDTYPFKASSGTCHVLPGQSYGVHVSNYTCSSFVGDELSLLETLVTHGPVMVTVDATNWNNYHGGVIQYHCGEVVSNHAVVLVGYNLSAPIPYYIARNSWGSDFGHDGYLYLKYGSDTCSIAQRVSAAWVS